MIIIPRGHLGSVFAINAIGLCLVACVGGKGGYTSDFDTYDPPPSSQEGAGNTREQPPRFSERAPATQEGAQRSFENAPGAQGVGGPGVSTGGGFDCSGTFTCVQSDGKKTSTISLTDVGGKCAAIDTKSESASSVVLEPDGRITLGGIPIGTWSAGANGFSVTVEKTTSNCTKGVTQTGSGSSTSSSSSSSSGGSSGNPTPPG
jgi:hypothetical protein